MSFKKITTEELKEILEKHLKWVNDEPYGQKADLSFADLHSANLRFANLSYANLSYADLRFANLSYANLSYANLSYADLRYADLSFADLSYADLSFADLDFSSGFSLQCSSFDVKIDLKIGSQLAYHFCRMCAEDPDVKKAQESLKELANKFHRVNECGELGDE